MAAVVGIPTLMGAVAKLRLVCAADSIQPNVPTTWGAAEESFFLGSSGGRKAELPAYNVCIIKAPAIIADGAPTVIVKNLDPTFVAPIRVSVAPTEEAQRALCG